ncbi:MAG: metallophosphoesterase, partial [Actinobacteria bacterium]|nr:metallophosphoesterase [Actinomycetota bacterium]
MGDAELIAGPGEEPGKASASSRESVAGAGWECSPGSYQQRLGKRNVPFSWLSPVPLWRSRNDRLARHFGDPTNDRRRAWVGQLDGSSDFVFEHAGGDAVSFLVIGDTGEGDASQFAVVPPLLRAGASTEFLFLCSDVIYPAGGVAEYEHKFFAAYNDYPAPIYAVPGNHDWYDDGAGFMFWLCRAEQPPPRGCSRPLSKAWVRDRLWRGAPTAGADAIERMRKLRAAPSQRSRQPGPYFALDVGPLRVVGIDTGITGVVDRGQGEWLRRVSGDSERPKVLLTGKPLYVDAGHRPGTIEGGGTVDEIVAASEHNYIAAIGGDIHNY